MLQLVAINNELAFIKVVMEKVSTIGSSPRERQYEWPNKNVMDTTSVQDSIF